MLIAMIVVLDENGNVQKEDSRQLIDRKEAADLEGWAQVLIRRWRAPVQKGFIIPIMWADEGETTFHCPLESGAADRLGPRAERARDSHVRAKFSTRSLYVYKVARLAGLSDFFLQFHLSSLV
jgi:hypothetical protein